MHRSLKIQTFQLTSNDPTSIIENAISLELGLYCSNNCRENCICTVAATVHQGVTILPPSRNLVPRFMKVERFVRKQETVIWTTSLASTT
jgi:hypothetical protein